MSISHLPGTVTVVWSTFEDFSNVKQQCLFSYSYTVAYNVILTPKGPKAISIPFLKFGQPIVKATSIKNSWIFLWTCGFVLASRCTNFYKIPIFSLVIMYQNAFFFSTQVAWKVFLVEIFFTNFHLSS